MSTIIEEPKSTIENTSNTIKKKGRPAKSQSTNVSELSSNSKVVDTKSESDKKVFEKIEHTKKLEDVKKVDSKQDSKQDKKHVTYAVQYPLTVHVQNRTPIYNAPNGKVIDYIYGNVTLLSDTTSEYRKVCVSKRGIGTFYGYIKHI